MDWESNSGGGKIFCTHPDQPWGPPCLLYNSYQVFPMRKAAGVWRWPPTPINTKVEGRVELYIYSPSWPSRPVLGWTLPYHYDNEIETFSSSVLYSCSFPIGLPLTQTTAHSLPHPHTSYQLVHLNPHEATFVHKFYHTGCETKLKFVNWYFHRVKGMKGRLLRRHHNWPESAVQVLV
jgi:hypothetical protein